MANHKSAIKRNRQTIVRTERNRYWRSTMRTAAKKVRAAIQSGDATAAAELLKVAVKTTGKVASKGVIHKKQAQRRISRLMKAVAAIAK
jgi:small subunit ribosomal protein S20